MSRDPNEDSFAVVKVKKILQLRMKKMRGVAFRLNNGLVTFRIAI